MYTFFLFLFLGLIVSLFLNKGTVTSFTKEKTMVLKAILPFLIIIHHTHMFEPDFYQMGAFVVSLFFFISGFGLENKRKSTGLEIRKLPQAIYKLLKPLFFPILLYYVCFYLFSDRDFYRELTNNLLSWQLALPYTWFILTLLVLYIIMYLCAFVAKRNVFFLITICTSILLFCVAGKVLGIPSWGRNTVTAFLAGVIYRNNEHLIIDRLRLINRGQRYLYAVLIVILLGIIISLSVCGITYPYFTVLDRPFYAYTWSTLFFCLLVFFPPVTHSVFSILGKISYEMYICQSIGFLLLGQFCVDNRFLFLFLLFVICIPVAWLCHIGTDYCTSFKIRRY